ncbi:MAG: hypothetical protein M1530_03395 [Candidatus Marsarchaeota archaeon]|nr:hypothetical protein [Candidatus Marsarchaeota archaeon]
MNSFKPLNSFRVNPKGDYTKEVKEANYIIMAVLGGKADGLPKSVIEKAQQTLDRHHGIGTENNGSSFGGHRSFKRLGENLSSDLMGRKGPVLRGEEPKNEKNDSSKDTPAKEQTKRQVETENEKRSHEENQDDIELAFENTPHNGFLGC